MTDFKAVVISPMEHVMLIGATGLIGQSCLSLLLEDDDFAKVTVFSRKDPGVKHPKLKTIITNFEKLGDYKKYFDGDTLISTMGSTIKKAGDKETFVRWDMEYPLGAAKIAHQNGCPHFLFVSAVGVTASSPFFYNRTKAEMEQASETIGFKRIDIFQPSMLLGHRNENRPLEKIAGSILPALSRFIPAAFSKYSPIQASDVARSIIKYVKMDLPGVHRHLYEDMSK